jgi:Ni/Fe-hydrogenase subunit HybB-like protein
MGDHGEAAPVGGRLFTNNFKFLTAFAVIAGVLIVWRFVFGLGSVTAMNDSFPWGVWKLFNVIVLTAAASGGYAMALLVYVLNKGQYHSLVRHALLTSAVGYSVAIAALGIDVGAPWNFWKVPTFTWAWNFDSVLLEVALCISAYLFVLWLEMSPAFMEKWAEDDPGWLGRLARRATPILDKAIIWLIALGIVLPSMHQSSLGSLYLLAKSKIHSFWMTPILPLLFLLSCWIMGYAVVVLTYILSTTRYRRPSETKMLVSLSRIIAWIIVTFLALRIGDLVVRDQIAVILSGDPYNWLLGFEFLAMGGSLLVLLRPSQRANLSTLMRAAMAILAIAGIYRLNVVWFGYRPGDGTVYFPSTPELLITLGFLAMQVMAYVAIVKRFPILPATRAAMEEEQAKSGAGGSTTELGTAEA